jgi:adenylate kinase family enzyme
VKGRPDLARTVVVGTSCSGKTTFARQLAARLGAPPIELDALHWLPDWQQRETGAFLALLDQATAATAGVADGNYGRVRSLLWPRASAIVWLNYPLPIVFARALRRSVVRGVRREELWSGNRESLRLAFLSRESILWWVLATYRRRRREYRTLFDQPPWPHLALIELAHPRATADFLASIPSVTGQMTWTDRPAARAR